MVNSRLFEQCQVVGEGRTQLLCETFLNVKPPMSKIIGESYDVQIADYTVFNDRVLVKGIVEKTFYYKHPHIGKSEEDSQKEATDKSNVQIVNKQNSKEEKKKDCESTEKQKKTNKFKCLDGWCKHIESYNGIVHFYQQKLEFAGTVEIPGIMPGDSCQVDLAEVKDYDAFVA
ncbi:MAG: DUF3794 domain-containing protein, partial [Peptococcaceae bacterium]|nr:DUF3794 domain-containing protein [Peptococcaceae bacterium]